MMRKTIYSYLCGFVLLSLHAQPPAEKTDMDQLIERLLSETAVQEGEDQDYGELAEDLYDYAREPLNLNRATEEELLKLPFLTPAQIHTLLEHRQRYGSLKSLYELAWLYGWDPELARQTALFAEAGPPAEKPLDLKRMLASGTHELLARYREQFPAAKGFLPGGAYKGAKQAYYTRYRYRVKDRFSVVLLAEKDAGEEFFKGSQKQGFDFYSGHIFLAPPKGIVKKVVLGDFRIQAGQGLAAWTGFSTGGGIAGTGFMKNARGLSVSSSANENLFLRGVALEIQAHKRWNLTLYGSYKRIDANVTEDSLAEPLFISALSGTGMHRTQTEIDRKGSVGEAITGLLLQYRASRWRVGFSAQYTGLSVPLFRADKPYALYRFTGQHLLNTSFYYMIKAGGGFLFGEWAGGSNGGWACVNGWQGSLSPLFRLALLQRHYSRRYTAFYSAGMRQYAYGAGETGVSFSLQCFPLRRLELLLYGDAAYTSWLTYTQPFPSYMAEGSADLRWKISRSAECGFRVRYRCRPEKSKLPSAVAAAEDTRKWDFRIQTMMHIRSDLRIQLRADAVQYLRADAPASRWGYLLAQDLVWQPVSGPLAFSLRYCIFHTSDYDTRIYSYERDLLYAFSVPAMQGKGQRVYLTMHIRTLRSWDIYLKTAYTWYAGAVSSGSGHNTISGNKRWELGLQTRWKWRNRPSVKK
ncbi:MAG: helix-hairpin-helix domain-containing protein [Bacteroidia bacterium]|nr:helix-hairpin-helix domain-containing protein [Bacteroidia bacterium]